MFWWSLGAIVIISLGLSLISLKKLEQKHEVEKVKKDLEKGRVIYHSSEESDSS